MTKRVENIDQGYQTEILFQEKMLRNLRQWQSMFSLLVGIGILVMYFFKNKSIWIFSAGIGISLVSVLLIIVIGYTIYRGRKNVSKVIDRYEEERRHSRT
ncbi:PTS sugar transporter [Leuconostoc miyukkimchii]|mgnify:CR=1 FL=1|uniref:PTS sugar transporter n=1 Tax=Leuconostoc miyukkimchii TaxID=910540 RepID=UPI001C7D1707|nr:PTS sugar transporter [Leuconostoc miyukkimchii]